MPTRRRAFLGPRLGPAIGALPALLALSLVAVPARAGITKGPWVQRVTSTSAIVRVEVDPPSEVTLDLGATGDAGARHLSSSKRGLHEIALDALQPSRRYGLTMHAGSASATATRQASFVTAPPPGSDTSFRFLVYGDNRSDDAAHAAVVHAMVPVASDFLIHTGDFVATGNSATMWQTFFDIEEPLLSTRCLFSCVGNHELTDRVGIDYARYFGPTDVPAFQERNVAPEHLNGTFRWGNSRFFLLNGMVGFKDSVDRAWLEAALTSADAEPGLVWRVLVVHHGLWSSGPHGTNARLLDAGIPALLRAHKIDLVISGHDHIYERGWGDGLAYIVSGGGGAPLYPIKARVPQARKAESAHHFIEMTVTPASIALLAHRVDGSVLDRCTLGKSPAGWDCDPGAGTTADGDRDGAAPPSANPASAVASTASPEARSRCGCRAAGVNDGGAARLPLLFGAGALVLRWLRGRRERRLAS